jgi:hypothetical protein
MSEEEREEKSEWLRQFLLGFLGKGGDGCWNGYCWNGCWNGCCWNASWNGSWNGYCWNCYRSTR